MRCAIALTSAANATIPKTSTRPAHILQEDSQGFEYYLFQFHNFNTFPALLLFDFYQKII